MADLASGAASWPQPMQLAPATMVTPAAAAEPQAQAHPAAAAQQQLPLTSAAPPALSKVEQLASADAAIAEVRAVAANGERLVEALADATSRTPLQLEQQVAALLRATAPVLQRVQEAWGQLQSQPPAQQAGTVAAGAADAVQVSLALGALQQQAAQLGPPSEAAPLFAATPGINRQSQAEALEQLASRVALVTGHPVRLMTAAPSAAGLPGKLHSCAAADATQVHMTVGETLVCCVALAAPGGLEAVRVAAFSAEEADGGTADAWAQSQHHVFQRISAWGMQALGHFQRRSQLHAFDGVPAADQELLAVAVAGAPLEDLLLWLATYDDLFTRRCTATCTLLAADAASLHCFPPLVRPFGLDRRELIAAARCGGGDRSRKAYHPHTAPPAVMRPA